MPPRAHLCATVHTFESRRRVIDPDNPAGWTVTTPAGNTPGAITGSIAPLNWAQGEYITLLAGIAVGHVIDIPAAVCARYHAY